MAFCLFLYLVTTPVEFF